MSEPPLKPLHSDISLSQAKLGELDKLTNQELIDSLKPGQPGSLKVRPDGMIIDIIESGFFGTVGLMSICCHERSYLGIEPFKRAS